MKGETGARREFGCSSPLYVAWIRRALFTAVCLCSWLPSSDSSTAEPRPPSVETAALFDRTVIVDHAKAQVSQRVVYDPAYRQIPYPMGDVPANRGVCSDVIIRAHRAVHIDLQQLVHEDMRSNFSRYPALWGLSRPDRNIDHRRVPNLQTFFARAGAERPRSTRPEDYEPGDIVTWNIGGRKNVPHIGLIVDTRSSDGLRPLVVHNIGLGPKMEDILFAYPITGHYRYTGSRRAG